MGMDLVAGLVGLGIFVVVVILLYNRFIRRRYAVRSAWADIDVHLKKRYDLVPGLVETVKGYAAHERATFEKVSEVRSAAMRASGPAEKSQTENVLTETLKSLFALAEAYPALKADTQFQNLMTQLREIEDNIEYARRYYNAAVLNFNIAIGVFPANIIASAFSFRPETFFELGESAAAREPVKVAFT
jgi:LemA protein